MAVLKIEEPKASLKQETKWETTLMAPLWKMRSGKFAGFRLNDALYDSQGENTGYFDDHIAHALDGECIGETYFELGRFLEEEH